MTWATAMVQTITHGCDRCVCAAPRRCRPMMMAIGRDCLIVSAPWVAPMHRWIMYKRKKNLPTSRPRRDGFASHTLVLDQALRDFHPSLHRHLKGCASAVGNRVDFALASLHDFGTGGHVFPLFKFPEHRIDRA